MKNPYFDGKIAKSNAKFSYCKLQIPQTFDIFKISNLPKLWQKPDANSILEKC